MKKSLLLITLLVISVSAFAAAPNFPDLPDVKLIIGTGLTPAFDIECFNTGDASTTWAQGGINFAGLSSVSSRWAIQGGFGSATVGSNSYTATNEGGTGTGTNKVKWSTYRIKKLPIVGLNVGDSVTVNVGNYVSPSIPPSFGTANALVISDTTKVTAAWNGNSQVSITLIASATGPVYVDVIASPTATPTIGYDQDKERISVYTNLLTNGGSFSTSADTGKWGAEIPVSGNTLMSIGWAASVNDAAGTPASGVMTLTATGNTQSYKGTNLQSLVPFVPGQWYTARMRYSASGAGLAGLSQAQTWIFSNIVNGTSHIDLATNITFKSNSTWTWLNIPVYSNQSGSGYAQMQFKPSGALVVNVDEVQIINAAPSLISATRGCDKYGYAYGDFDTAADTTGGWAIEGYNTAVNTKPGISIAGGVATLSFTGSLVGTKWTASPSGGVVVTPAVSEVGKDVGIKYSVTQQSGGFTNYASLVAQWVYGVPTNGGLDFITTGGQLIGAAEFGGVTNGTHYAVGPSAQPYYQFQFGVKGDQSASIVIDNVDFISDNDDPNFGDQILFP